MWNVDSQRYQRLVTLVGAATDEDAARELTREAARRADPRGLAAACAGLAPTTENWLLLCACVERCAPEAALQHLRPALERWPAHLREMPPAWVDRLLEGQDDPRFALVGRLDLGWRWFEPALLARARHLAALEELALAECDLGPALADGLVAAQQLTALRRLDLARNNLGNKGAIALSRARHLRSVVSLDLAANTIGEPGMRALVDAPLCEGLRALVLRDNPIGDEGARLLVSAAVLDRLHELDLHRCAIGDDGIEALARVMRAGGLRTLDIGANLLGHAGQHAIDTLRARGWMDIR